MDMYSESARASAAEDIIPLYERHADTWAEIRGNSGFIESQWMQRFETLLPPGGAVLDIGCGSGSPIAAHFIEHGFDVVGIDSSAGMIGHCRERFPDHEWIVGDMRELSLGRRFHGLLAWDSFFHLTHEDQRSMFARFAGHAAPGAALMFTSGTDHDEAIGEFERERLYHASLTAEEYRKLLESSGFRVLAHKVEDPECGEHTIWLAQAGNGGQDDD